MLSLVGTGFDFGPSVSATILQAPIVLERAAEGFENAKVRAKRLDYRRGGPAGVRGRMHRVFCQPAKFNFRNNPSRRKHFYGSSGIDGSAASYSQF
jgi:hypothetical protein